MAFATSTPPCGSPPPSSGRARCASSATRASSPTASRSLTDEALTFLWRVRNELHFLSGHKNDVLSRDVQPQVAKNFGYQGDESQLAVEKFMRDYYLHARVIHRVSRRLIARCRDTLSRRGSVGRTLRQDALADGLYVLDGQIHVVHRDGRDFRRSRRAS